MNLAESSLRKPAGVLLDVVPLGEPVCVDSTAGAGGFDRVEGHRPIGLGASPSSEFSLGPVVKVQLS